MTHKHASTAPISFANLCGKRRSLQLRQVFSRPGQKERCALRSIPNGMTKTEEGFALLVSFLGVPNYFGYVADYRRESEEDLPSIASRARGTLTQPLGIVASFNHGDYQ
jgi:hypothetical protein